ncbi:MAG: EscU/YscU/HrcU family type III secretion system export apparatus switch protein, partial [Planctomycetota bacterium]
MAEDLGEKTEDATPKRREDARKKGQVAKSTDLGALILLASAMVAIAVAMGMLLERGAELIRVTLAGDHLADPVRGGEVGPVITFAAREAALVAAPVLGAIMLAAAIAHLVQIGPLL